MQNVAGFALLAFTSVLFIVNPLGMIPTYLVITQAETPAQRARMAKRACIAAMLILIAFAFAGQQIFQLFGITIDAFRIAGGLILWVVAMDMLHGVRRTQEGAQEIAEGTEKADVALTPLAMPMLAGPGAIATVMVLAGQANRLAEKLALVAAIVLTMGLSWMVLRVGERLVRHMGQTGIRVMSRIMGLLLAAISVEFVATGVRHLMGLAGAAS